MTQLDQYDYDLPRELIAQWPLAERADARLMVIDRSSHRMDHRHVRDLREFLRPGDCLVLNDTRVIPARLVGRRQRTGGFWQGLFLSNEDEHNWRMLCKTRGKLVAGESIELLDRDARPAGLLRMLTRLDDGVWIARADPVESPHELLERLGRIPLPPYIRGGQMVDGDQDNYQTVYARHDGSVAAPTAGLHFTRRLLDELEAAGVGIVYVTLHVGRHSFQPIKHNHLNEHPMFDEWCSLSPEAASRLQDCRRQGHRIIGVGTTSVRVLETAARQGGLEPWTGNTDLFIQPPFEFQAVDGLFTNFHLPRTTLFVLACTFAGDRLIKDAYAEAIREQYRFYSYGDAMLIL